MEIEARMKHRKDGKWNLDVYENGVYTKSIEGLGSQAEAFAAAKKRNLPVTEIMPDDDNYEHPFTDTLEFPNPPPGQKL